MFSVAGKNSDTFSTYHITIGFPKLSHILFKAKKIISLSIIDQKLERIITIYCTCKSTGNNNYVTVNAKHCIHI